MYCNCLFPICIFSARSLVVSVLRLETKGSRFESGCYLCAEVNSAVIELKPTKFHCLIPFFSWDIGQYMYCNCLFPICIFSARSLVVSVLRLETKGSRFESGCYLCAEVNSAVIELKPTKFHCLIPFFSWDIGKYMYCNCLFPICIFSARSLVFSVLRSEIKGSRFESGCYLCAEINSLQ